jgi:hypothetical protein
MTFFSLIFLIAITPQVRWIPLDYAGMSGGGCVLSEDKAEVWVRVYQEMGPSEQGSLIWDGHLNKGETHPLDPQPKDRIRYDYKIAPNNNYHGNVGATCQDGGTISVP